MDFSETKTEIFQADEKTKLLSRMWLPSGKPKAIFLAIHGGMAHGGDWVTSALYFKKKGIATYALDLRWHGTYDKHNPKGKIFFHADSYNEYAEDIHHYYEMIKEQNPGVPIFVLGHSNGALIAFYYGLTIGEDDDIKGYAVSSPWLENIVELPKAVVALSKVLSRIAPKMAVAPEPLTDVLTHDAEITARHHRDEEIGIRGTKATVRIGAESMKAQKFVLDNIASWKAGPVFAVIAGEDRLADPDTSNHAMESIPGNNTTIVNYPDNFHENFNEVNREEIYGKIWDWMQKLL